MEVIPCDSVNKITMTLTLLTNKLMRYGQQISLTNKLDLIFYKHYMTWDLIPRFGNERLVHVV